MTKEALKLALEALNLPSMKTEKMLAQRDEAITAIKEALAQPEQEPVAKYSDIVSDGGLDPRNKFDTAPPKRPWVGLTDEDISSVLSNLQVMYNRPPTTDSRAVFARAIEAKLKEKNT